MDFDSLICLFVCRHLQIRGFNEYVYAYEWRGTESGCTVEAKCARYQNPEVPYLVVVTSLHMLAYTGYIAVCVLDVARPPLSHAKLHRLN